jgi:hypothetical protein
VRSDSHAISLGEIGLVDALAVESESVAAVEISDAMTSDAVGGNDELDHSVESRDILTLELTEILRMTTKRHRRLEDDDWEHFI